MKQAHPFGTEITAEHVQETLSTMQGWENRYRQVIQWGKQLPALAEEARTDGAKVSGCESNVWLHWHLDDNGRYQLAADSDARIVKGLVCLVLAAYHNKTAPEIQAFDFSAYFAALGMENHLTPTRSNGIYAIVEKIKQIGGS
ncbi:cysteine desulfurase sulfur acceptor subunit CsdE [Thaumasiovibrio subtropicus]|uniref:cysteine desulfurase sulfur acceptor subunit CsdE n=1 Tax=Thaumasiovibrio subtropicus TaxID=1891207 RepID=UPI000B364849|nr:cysteine desulfurase sulfur acceptor subunit CsdE [Thaumasiovibrio subtropicus]